MTVRVYKSTDVGAPVVTGQPGSFINFLDTILVGTDGVAYGNKEPLGWTKEFSGTNIAAYRMSTTVPGSSGAYVKVWNVQGGQNCFARAYKNMTSLTAGENETPTTGQRPNARWVHSEQNDATTRPWCLIGDERTFYFTFINNQTAWSDNAYTTLYGFGDYDSFSPGHTHNFFIMTSEYSYDPYRAFSDAWSLDQARTSYICLGRDVTDTGTSTESGIICPGKWSGHQSAPPHPNLYTGQIHSAPAMVSDRHGYAGKLRGVNTMMTRIYPDWLRYVGPSLETPNEEPFIQFHTRHPSGSWYTGAFLVKQSNW